MTYPELRTALDGAAQGAVGTADAASLVRAGVARYRRRRRRSWIGGTALVAAVAVATPLAVLATRGPATVPLRPATPTYDSIFDWPIRGDLARDRATVQVLSDKGSNRVLFLGHGPNNLRYAVLVGGPREYGASVVSLCSDDDPRLLGAGADFPQGWACADTSHPYVDSVTAAGVLLVGRTPGNAVSMALAPPSGHVTAMTEPFTGMVEDSGRMEPPDGVRLVPVSESAPGLVIRFADPGGANSATSPLGVQATVQPRRGAASTHEAVFVPYNALGNDIHSNSAWGEKQGSVNKPRGDLPPLLDDPNTFPGLRLWARLHGMGDTMPGYYSAVWGGPLADGSHAIVIQPSSAARVASAFMVNPPGKGTSDVFLVRDLDNPREDVPIHQVSAYLPLSDGRCELVVVGQLGTTRITYQPDPASAATDLPIPRHDGVGMLVVPSCANHTTAHIQVYTHSGVVYDGAIDSTRSGAGRKP